MSATVRISTDSTPRRKMISPNGKSRAIVFTKVSFSV